MTRLIRRRPGPGRPARAGGRGGGRAAGDPECGRGGGAGGGHAGRGLPLRAGGVGRAAGVGGWDHVERLLPSLLLGTWRGLASLMPHFEE